MGETWEAITRGEFQAMQARAEKALRERDAVVVALTNLCEGGVVWCDLELWKSQLMAPPPRLGRAWGGVRSMTWARHQIGGRACPRCGFRSTGLKSSSRARNRRGGR